MRVIRNIFIVLGVILLILVVAGSLVFFYLNNRNAARPEALAALESDEAVTVTTPEGEDWYVFMPNDVPTDGGFIIYPGGFVDPRAYAPLARGIAEAGFPVVIVPMPLNLAVLDYGAADGVIAAFPEIGSWAIGGHSLGGAMAAEYIAGNPTSMEGLSLWAGYPAENTNLSALPLAAVSLYGDADGVASMDTILASADRLPPDAEFVLIPGGNHTQFGSYGEGLQRGDNPAGISREDQQAIVIDETIRVLESIVAGD